MTVSIDGTKPSEAQRAWQKTIAKAWADPAFKRKLIADPREILVAEGVHLSPAATIKVVENTATVTHLVLPPPPDGDLSEAELEKVAAGLKPFACGAGTCKGKGN